jgi:hypothetical protein
VLSSEGSEEGTLFVGAECASVSIFPPVSSSASTKRLQTAPKVGEVTASKMARHMMPRSALAKVLASTKGLKTASGMTAETASK